jgi:RNA polymerase sigma-70 factor (ECF subfamily)
MNCDDQFARALLKQIIRREEQAMASFYKAFERNVYAFALRRLGNQGEAEEVAVETMHEVWKNAGRFRGDSQVRTWVLGIARHKLLDKLRARSQAYEELDETTPSEDLSGFDLLARRQRAQNVLKCLSHLPDEQRDCMHLVFYEELSLAEIAKIQNCPENTVKTRLFHARRKIKQCLEGVLAEENK